MTILPSSSAGGGLPPWWASFLVTSFLLLIAAGLAFTDRFEGLVGGIIGGVVVHWLPPRAAPEPPVGVPQPRNG